MNVDHEAAWAETVRWLARHAGFPRVRLPARAELLVCMSALAVEESARPGATGHVAPRDPAQTAALKAHALRRSRVHFKCDNSAKV